MTITPPNTAEQQKNAKHQKISPLAPKNGVFANSHWLPTGPWESYLEYLEQKFPHISKRQWLDRISRKEVVTNDRIVIQPGSRYSPNQHIYFYRELDSEQNIPFKEKVIFENDEILVVDKPHFLPVAPSGNYLHETLLVRLRQKYKNDEIELCHRLDRETAGLVLLSKKQSNRAAYSQLFSQRKIEKIYWAVAPFKRGEFPIKRCSKIVKGVPYFKMKEVEGRSNSETLIEKLHQKGDLALYQLTPKTGKKHQLRLHLAALGIPIKNDRFYPELNIKEEEDYKDPLQLLAKSLKFIDPICGKTLVFESRLELQCNVSN